MKTNIGVTEFSEALETGSGKNMSGGICAMRMR
jgi:hypothetical protein